MRKYLQKFYLKWQSDNRKFNQDLQKKLDKCQEKIDKKRKREALKFKYLTLKFLFPKVYKKYSKLPVDENKVIFLEIRLPSLTSNFKLIYDELANNYDYTLHCHFLRSSFVSRPVYIRRCNNFVQDLATAKYVFINEASNVIGALNLREETVVTQLWHGCGAFKKFGKSTADLIFGDTKSVMERFPYHRNYTYATLSSPEVKWAYEEAFGIKDDIFRPIGTSRTDVFFNDDFKARAFERFYRIMPEAKGRKVILYAPTFRGRVATAETPDMLNIKMFAESLSDEYVLVFKHHPVVKEKPKIPDEYRGSFAMDLSDMMTIDDLLCVTDICISDYSSLVFEYSLFEKPMIFFAYDKNDYDDWRGFYYDYSEFCPGPIVTTNREMIDYITDIYNQFDKEKVKAFKEKFMSACDGHVTDRVLQTVFTKEGLKKHYTGTDDYREFSNVPNWRRNDFNIRARIDLYKRMKKDGQTQYNELSKAPVDEKLVAVYNTYAPEIIAKEIEKYGYKAVPLDKKDTFSKHIPILAKAKYIILNSDYELIDILKLRKETKVIYMSSDPFMFELFGKHSLEYISGIWKERYSIATYLKNCDYIISSSKETAKRDAFCTEIDENQIKLCGNVTADLMNSEELKKVAIKKLKEYRDVDGKPIMPKGFEKKKVIAYLPMNRYEGIFDGANEPSDSYLYEYLHKDYIILKHFGVGLPKKETLPYYNDSIVDVTKAINSYELLSMADIVIGDYRDSTFSAAASGKPIFIYAPENNIYASAFESDFDFLDIAPAPIFENSKELCEAIVDVKNYDYSKMTEFKEKYLKKCDGNACKQLCQLFDTIK